MERRRQTTPTMTEPIEAQTKAILLFLQENCYTIQDFKKNKKDRK